MPELSREAKSVYNDVRDAKQVATDLGFLDQALVLDIARLIGEERRGHKKNHPVLVPNPIPTKKPVESKADPVAEARKHPKSPLVPASTAPAARTKSSRKKAEPKALLVPKPARKR